MRSADLFVSIVVIFVAHTLISPTRAYPKVDHERLGLSRQSDYCIALNRERVAAAYKVPYCILFHCLMTVADGWGITQLTRVMAVLCGLLLGGTTFVLESMFKVKWAFLTCRRQGTMNTNGSSFPSKVAAGYPCKSFAQIGIQTGVLLIAK